MATSSPAWKSPPKWAIVTPSPTSRPPSRTASQGLLISSLKCSCLGGLTSPRSPCAFFFLTFILFVMKFVNWYFLLLHTIVIITSFITIIIKIIMFSFLSILTTVIMLTIRIIVMSLLPIISLLLLSYQDF